MTEDEKARFFARFFAARTPEELLELGRELAREHPGDPFALSLGEMVANAIAQAAPGRLAELEDEA